MARYLKTKNFFLRKKLKKSENKKLLYKFLNKSLSNEKIMKFKIMLKYQIFNRDINNKVFNMCIDSSQTRSVYRITNLSKSLFKKQLSTSNVNGFKKAS